MTQTLKQPHILLVEDAESLALMYKTALGNLGYAVSSFGTAHEALEYVETNKTDLVLLDLKLPDMDGLDAINLLRQRRCMAPVIIITGHGSINIAVEAMRKGARDFLIKPFSVERLQNAVESELNKDPMESMPPELAGVMTEEAEEQIESDMTSMTGPSSPVVTDAVERKDFGGFIGTSQIMQKVYEQIEAAARSQATVFITGDSGTGKEVCAEAIHKHGPRANKPFIPINCAAIPRDLMESELFGHVKGAFTGAISDREGAAKLANGGTLFLDEIAEMNPDMQTKLLRFLQNFTFQPVGGSRLETTDVRIICATNRNPLEEIEASRFREDLFYRLHVLPLYMPPLRERGDDIIDIAITLLKRYVQEEGKRFTGFTIDAEDILRAYHWPGNIRQLQNVVRNVIVMHDGELVTAKMLPPELLHRHMTGRNGGGATQSSSVIHFPQSSDTASAIKPLADVEREAIENAINHFNGNIPKAAAALGVSPSTIYRKKTA